MHPSARLAQDFAQATGQTPVIREVKLVGSRAVRNLLARLRRAGKSSRHARMRFRRSGP